MDKIRISIVEDNKEDANILIDYLNKAMNELSLIGDISLYDKPLQFLDKYNGNCDIVFMDIELPGANGLETSKLLREKDQNVILIFITNMAQYAVDGYLVDAMDFIVKPVSYPNLLLKIQRAYKKISSNFREKIIINDKTSSHVVPIRDIKYIEVFNHRLVFHTLDGDLTSFGSLSKMEEQLGKYNFSRCNNCYLVNLKFVTKIDDFTLYLGNETLAISRSKKKSFLKDVADYLGGSI